MKFHKTISPDFDRIDVTGHERSEWLKIEMQIGHTNDRASLTLRSTEAVRDLHYTLARYLQTLDGVTK